MIAEYGLALQLEATAEDIHHTIHAHPTMSEAMMEAAAAARGLGRLARARLRGHLPADAAAARGAHTAPAPPATPRRRPAGARGGCTGHSSLEHGATD